MRKNKGTQLLSLPVPPSPDCERQRERCPLTFRSLWAISPNWVSLPVVLRQHDVLRALARRSSGRTALQGRELVASSRHTYHDHAACLTYAGSANVMSPKQGGITRRKVAGLICYSRCRSRLVPPARDGTDVTQIHGLTAPRTAHRSSDRPGTKGLIWQQGALII